MAAPRNENIQAKILDSATFLLQQQSFSDITLAAIATHAKISKGTLYYYYNCKEDILFDLTDRYLTGLAHRFYEWVDNREKDTSLPRMVKYILEFGCDDTFGNLRLYLIGAAISGNQPLRERFVQRYCQFLDLISSKIVERAPQAEATYISWLLLVTMDGMLVQRQLQNPLFDTEGFIKKTVSLITM